MNIRNVDNAPYSEKNGKYGGASCKKEGLVIDGQDWMVKYPKNASELSKHEEMSYTNDPVSEYLGSHIYGLLGYPVHETMLVKRKNKIAVACKDFIDTAGERLKEIREIINEANKQLATLLERDFHSTGSAHVVDFEDMLLHLEHNKNLANVDGLKERFFDMLVIDIFTNNSDRNNGNWGIIRSPGHPDRLAPVFDNGGSFRGKTPDSRLERTMKSEDSMKDSILNEITAFGKEGKNFLSRNVIKMDIPELRQAIVKNVPKIKENMENICHLMDELPDKACSPVRKEFYKRSLAIRMELMLEPEYEKILNLSSQKYTPGIANTELDKTAKPILAISSILANRPDGEPYKDSPNDMNLQEAANWKTETNSDKLKEAVLFSNGKINRGAGLIALRNIMENPKVPVDALVLTAMGKLDNQGNPLMTNADVRGTWQHILKNPECPPALAADIVIETILNKDQMQPEIFKETLDEACRVTKDAGFKDMAGVIASYLNEKMNEEKALSAIDSIMKSRGMQSMVHSKEIPPAPAPGKDLSSQLDGHSVGQNDDFLDYESNK